MRSLTTVTGEIRVCDNVTAAYEKPAPVAAGVLGWLQAPGHKQQDASIRPIPTCKSNIVFRIISVAFCISLDKSFLIRSDNKLIMSLFFFAATVAVGFLLLANFLRRAHKS